MKDMAHELALQAGQSFTRQQAIDWFAQNYPKIKTGTVHCHLIRLSTNAPTRRHYNAKPEEDDVFFQLDGSHFRLYDPAHDPPPIREAAAGQCGNPPPAGDDIEQRGSAEFAYEADLRNYLSRNLSIIEPGLRLYQEEGITGVEFPVGGRFIDILAVDAKNALVVIELKVSRGYDRVVGQLMRYVAWIQNNQAEQGQRVRGVIVAREISEDLLLACSLLSCVQLFEYELSLKVNPVNPEGST
ncbi:MAG: nuclease [Planctomycetes bacterium RBG_13_62_9]|nr:MAG: nuclease [Planctomycetes bacterium RBG_13_62_9]